MITSPEITAFRNKKDLREALAAALDLPEVQLAISCIRKAAVPKPPSEKEIIQHADIILARRYVLMSGTNDGFDTLLEMAKETPPPIPGEAALMSHAFDDSAAVRQFPSV